MAVCQESGLRTGRQGESSATQPARRRSRVSSPRSVEIPATLFYRCSKDPSTCLVRKGWACTARYTGRPGSCVRSDTQYGRGPVSLMFSGIDAQPWPPVRIVSTLFDQTQLQVARLQALGLVYGTALTSSSLQTW